MKRSLFAIAAAVALGAALLVFTSCVPYTGVYYDYGYPYGYYSSPYSYYNNYDDYYGGGPGGLILNFGYHNGFDRDDFGHGDFDRGHDFDHDHDRD